VQWSDFVLFLMDLCNSNIMSLKKKIRKLVIQWKALIFVSIFGMIANFVWANIGKKVFANAAAQLTVGNYSYASWRGGAFLLLIWAGNWVVAEIVYCIMLLAKVIITRDNQKKLDKIVIDTINSIHPSYFISEGIQNVRIYISNLSKHFNCFFHNCYDHILQPVIFTVVSIISVFLLDDWRLGVLTIGWIGVIGIILALTVKKQMKYSELSAQSRAEFKKQRAEVMEQIQLYDIYNAKAFAKKILMDASAHSIKSKFRFNMFNLLRNYLIYFVVIVFCVFGLLGIGLWAIPRGEISATTFMAFAGIQSSIIFRVLGIFRNTQKFLSTLAQLRLSIKKIDEIGTMKTGGKTINNINSIELKNFSLIKGKKQIIKNLDLKINAGEIIGIFGPSGCGKSSIMRSISGIEERYKGEILFNGIDRRKLDRRSFNECITYIPQNPQVVNSTIGNNVTLGKKLGEKKIKDALKKTSLFEMVKGDSNVLNRQVGYGGSKLSGGQIQSLSNARALAKNKKGNIIIGDEITANLDDKNANDTMEQIIQEARKNKQIVVIISHNTEDFGFFDRILYQNKQGIWKITTSNKIEDILNS
jgi:ABC-type multidrug transport system fused ATPase/permease subunit